MGATIGPAASTPWVRWTRGASTPVPGCWLPPWGTSSISSSTGAPMWSTASASSAPSPPPGALPGPAALPWYIPTTPSTKTIPTTSPPAAAGAGCWSRALPGRCWPAPMQSSPPASRSAICWKAMASVPRCGSFPPASILNALPAACPGRRSPPAAGRWAFPKAAAWSSPWAVWPGRRTSTNCCAAGLPWGTPPSPCCWWAAVPTSPGWSTWPAPWA